MNKENGIMTENETCLDMRKSGEIEERRNKKE
jgi:hypothetical protein